MLDPKVLESLIADLAALPVMRPQHERRIADAIGELKAQRAEIERLTRKLGMVEAGVRTALGCRPMAVRTVPAPPTNDPLLGVRGPEAGEGREPGAGEEQGQEQG